MKNTLNPIHVARILSSCVVRFLSIFLLSVISIHSAWAGFTVNGGEMYFDYTNFTETSYVQLCVGTSEYTSAYTMTKIANTNLAYYSLSSWGGATYIGVMGNSSSWGSGSWGPTNITSNAASYASPFTSDWTFNSGNCHLLTSSTNANKTGLNVTYISGGYSALNYAQTLQCQISTDGGATYTTQSASNLNESSTKKAYLAISAYALNSASTATASSASFNGASSSCNAARSASEVFFSLLNIHSSYTFAGWYLGDTFLSSDTSYTYSTHITGTNTFNARFIKKMPIQYTAGAGGTITAPVAVAEGATSVAAYYWGTTTITAVPNSGYNFAGWEVTFGSATIANPSSATTTFTCSDATTGAVIRANFTAAPVYPVVTISAGTGGSVSPSGAQTLTSGSLSVTATADQYYHFYNWLASGGASVNAPENEETTLTATSDGTLTAVFYENTTAVTLVASPNLYGTISPASPVNAGCITPESVTATPNAGYRFTGWTITGDATISDASTATTAVTGNGVQGTTATLTAHFDEDLTTDWDVRGSMDSWTAHPLVKRTGESTASVGYYTASLAAETTYEFKIVKSSSTWFGNTGTMTYSNHTNWTFSSSESTNAKLTTTIAGDYTFRVDFSNASSPKVTVIYPTATVYFKNDLGWTNVYAYFYSGAYWSSTLGSGSKSGGTFLAGPIAMTAVVGHDNLFEVSTVDGFNPLSGGVVAFTKDSQTDYQNFSATEAVYRADFATQYNSVVFVPNATSNQTLNTTVYYNDGTWRPFSDENYSNYYLTGYTSDWTSATEFPFSATPVTELSVTLSSNTTYEFKIQDRSQTNVYYGNDGTMTQDNCTSWTFSTTANNCRIHTLAAGNYIFRFNVLTKKLSVVYPNLYRVRSYVDASHTYYSNVVYAVGDSLSYFASSTGTLTLQHSTSNGWEDVASLTAPSSSNVYTSVFNGTTETNRALYSGAFYIRTDYATGGWSDYKTNSDNLFIYFEPNVNFPNETYNHYWVKFVASGTNADGCIANRINPSLAQRIGADAFTTSSGAIPGSAGGNVRFSYNNFTGEFSRAILGGSGTGSTFLQLYGDALNEEGDDIRVFQYSDGGSCSSQVLDVNHKSTFTDLSNWNYEVDMFAQPGAKIILYSLYNGNIFYLLGMDAGNDPQSACILGATTTAGCYHMRVIYDYRMNRIISGWVPAANEEISSSVSIDANMIIMRQENQSAHQVVLSSSSVEVDKLQQLYTVLELRRDVLTNSDSAYHTGGNGGYRSMYWISLPYDCYVKDVFGVPGYGTKWVIQRYRGDKRAELSWTDDIATFWANMKQNNTAKLEANRGYVLSLNLSESDFKEIVTVGGTRSAIRFYFPSITKSHKLVQETTKTITVPAQTCTVKDREIKDSNWNIMGVPGVNNIKVSSLSPESSAWDWSNSAYYGGTNFLYTWDYNGGNKTYTIHDGKNFTYRSTFAYMVQYAGNVTWQPYTSSPKTIVARQHESVSALSLTIALSQDGNVIDRTILKRDADAHAAFVLGEDMSKLFSDSRTLEFGATQLYTLSSDSVACGGQIVDPLTSEVPLGLQVESAGQYTFSLLDTAFTAPVYLRDNQTGALTDIASSSYEVALDEGTYNNRFVLVLESNGITTSLSNTASSNLSISVYEGQLVVSGLADATMVRLYDAAGRLIEETQLSPSSNTLSLSGVGVYIVNIGGEVRKVVVDE